MQRVKLILIGIVLMSLVVAFAFPYGFNGINRPPNFIGVVELAEKIKSREDFVLIDLRADSLYNQFHLPSAKNLTPEDFDLTRIQGPVVVYSGDDHLSRLLWKQLSTSERVQVRVLYGGLRHWYDYLLYPKLPFGEEVKGDQTLEQIHDLCEFYGGYVDFVDDPGLMNYYQQDLERAAWPKVQLGGKLVRKGC